MGSQGEDRLPSWTEPSFWAGVTAKLQRPRGPRKRGQAPGASHLQLRTPKQRKAHRSRTPEMRHSRQRVRAAAEVAEVSSSPEAVRTPLQRTPKSLQRTPPVPARLLPNAERDELLDALRTQLHLQKQLQDQLEEQRQLQLSLELHCKYIGTLLQNPEQPMPKRPRTQPRAPAPEPQPEPQAEPEPAPISAQELEQLLSETAWPSAAWPAAGPAPRLPTPPALHLGCQGDTRQHNFFWEQQGGERGWPAAPVGPPVWRQAIEAPLLEGLVAPAAWQQA